MSADRPITNTENMPDNDDVVLGRAVMRLSGNILGLVLGILFSLILFVATNWLVLKGGPVVGPHLRLLNQYFIGYSVSFVGSLIAIPYALVTGYIAGFVIAWVYNSVVYLTRK